MSDDVRAGAHEAVRRVLSHLGEDVNREGLQETPARHLKALEFFTSGYAQRPEDVLKTFEEEGEILDEMVLQTDIPVWSTCEHHLLPFFGVAHIAYIPKDRIVGLSKMSRLIDIFARRLQVQERLTVQIANALDGHLRPGGVGVVLQCRHTCMEARGVRIAGSMTTTSALRGLLKEAKARDEFLRLAKTNKKL